MKQSLIGRKQLSGILGLLAILAVCGMALGGLDTGVAITAIGGITTVLGLAVGGQALVDHKEAGKSNAAPTQASPGH